MTKSELKSSVSAVNSAFTLAQSIADRMDDELLDDISKSYTGKERLQMSPVFVLKSLERIYSDEMDAWPRPNSKTDDPKYDPNSKTNTILFDKWSKQVANDRGGMRNVNYSFYRIVFDRTKLGKEIADKTTVLNDAYKNFAKEPLPREYQHMKKHELRSELSLWTQRASVATSNIRTAVQLQQQFKEFEQHLKDFVAFGIQQDKDGDPVTTRLPINVKVTTKNEAGGTDSEYKDPISIATFLGYNPAIALDAIKNGEEVWQAIVSSASKGADESKPKTFIKLPLTDESFFEALAMCANYVDKPENFQRIKSRLGKRDEQTKKLVNEAEMKTVLDFYYELSPVEAAFRTTYEQLTLTDSQAANKERAAN